MIKHKTNKKILIIFSLIVLTVLLLDNFCYAQKPLEIKYPRVLGKELSEKPLLPEYIKYIFNLALLLGGLIAFGALVLGGFRYMSSVGSPPAMDDAKDQIFSGILGLVILLSSYLILTTVNPQLVILKTKKTPIKAGVVLCSADCTTDAQLMGLAEDKKKYIGINYPSLEGFTASHIHFLSSSGDLEAIVYPQENWEGKGEKITSSGPLPIVPKSIMLRWKLPGVYLVDTSTGEEVFLTSDIPNLSVLRFEDKANKIKFKLSKNDVDKNVVYGAVLHEDREYQGQGKIFLSNSGKGSSTTFLDGSEEIVQDIQGLNEYGDVEKPSSVHIFTVNNNPASGYVKLCEKEECQPGGEQVFEQTQISPPYKLKDLAGDNLDDNLRAIEIEGNYLLVLFENDNATGKCAVFKRSIPKLTDYPIGKCGIDVCIPFVNYCFWSPCPSSFAIYPIK